MRALRRLLAAACLVLVVPGVSGCWDAEDPERTAHVVALGVDRGVAAPLRVTFQVSVPRGVSPGAGAGGGGAGGGSPEAARVWVRAVEAEGLAEAVDAVAEYLPRAVALSHLQALVVSEQVARERGVGALWDFLTRDPQARRAAQLVVTPGRAEEVLLVQPRFADLPAASLADLLEQAADTGATIATPAGRFGVALHTEGIEPVAAMVEVVPPQAAASTGGQAGGQPGGQQGRVPPSADLRACGLAVMRGDRMVGVLGPGEAAAVSLALRRARRPVIRTQAPDSRAPVAARVLSYRPRVEMARDGGFWRGRVALDLAAELREDLTPTYILEPARLGRLEEALATVLTRDLASAVRRTQEIGADVLGFGWWLYRNRPAEWFAVRDRWDVLYRQLPVDVTVRVVLRAEGMAVKSPLRLGAAGRR